MSSTKKKPEYTHISLPVPQMKPKYDVVVIGSGYGGAIAASRMSRAGKRVALLERGKEKWPGEYPTTLRECIKETQYSSPKHQSGNKTGMFRFYNGSDQDAFTACGLGGTSLVNANVALEADDRVWNMGIWPEDLKDDYETIKKGYDKAREMLEPTQYPTSSPELPKLRTLEEQAKSLGDDYYKNFYRVPITVTFEDRINNAGVQQYGSTLTGNDCTGVNDGSKNSTLMNYIPDAWNHGCEIFCQCDVQRIKKIDGKYIVFYEWLDDNRTNFAKESHRYPFFVIADVVFLAAGTLGSNEILLRSRSYGGLKVSDNLGRGFSGNGDILGFGYNMDSFVNGVGSGKKVDMKAPVGPCITGVIDMRREAENVLKGYVIEEGVVPPAIGKLFQVGLKSGSSVIGDKPDTTYSQSAARKWRQVKSVFGGFYTGATSHTQTYLVMSHDDNTGQLELENDQLKIDYKGVGSSENVKELNKVLEKATHSSNGTYIPSPLWTKLLGHGLVTVHPIGGCNMGKSGKYGVINHKGQVFIGKGDDVHEGLYVCDGSIIPTSLGVNPFFTISALAERICEYAAKDRGWTIDYDLKNKIDFKKQLKVYDQFEPDLIKSPKNHELEGGICFTEVMKGYFSTEVKSTDYVTAELQAASADSTMQFLLTIIAYNADTLVNMDDHQAIITGTISCRALSPDPLLVTRGKFRLFIPETDKVDSNRMMYNLNLSATDGTRYRFKGYKLVKNGKMKEAWKQTTNLYVTVYKREDGEPEDLDEVDVPQEDEEADSREIVGRGILQMNPYEFLKQLTTLKATGQSDWSRIHAMVTFNDFFAKTMLKHIFVRFLPLVYPSGKSTTRQFRSKRLNREIWEITADDGVKTKLFRYQGGRKGPILLIHGAAMSHEMWSTNLIKNNFLDHLLENRYDVFLTDYRLSPTNPACKEQHTLDDIKLDHAAAVNKVREITGVKKIGIIAHCVGSISTFMGLLDGTIEGVGCLVGSQVAMHPILSFGNNVKMHLQVLPLWKHVLRQSEFDVRTSPETSLLNKFVNQALRFYPVSKTQTCRSALCHRASLCYGVLYQHENISQQIHDHQDDFFGTINMTTMQHLHTMGQQKVILNYQGDKNAYATKENIRNKLDFPICLMQGELNAVFDIKSTKRTYDTLRTINNPDNYVHIEVDKYGHLDCWWGTNANKDVYTKVLDYLEDTQHLWGYNAGKPRKVYRDSSTSSSDE